jgi:hypothetical protein
MDLDLDPGLDPTPDPTPFFSDFKDAKKYFFFIFFSYNLPYLQTHYLISLKFIFCKNFVLKFYFASFVSHRKGKDLELDPDPYLWLMDLDPGGLKTSGSGSPILLLAAQAVYNWTRTRMGTGSRLVVWGHSLGTAVSSHLGIVQHTKRGHQCFHTKKQCFGSGSVCGSRRAKKPIIIDNKS